MSLEKPQLHPQFERLAHNDKLTEALQNDPAVQAHMPEAHIPTAIDGESSLAYKMGGGYASNLLTVVNAGSELFGVVSVFDTKTREESTVITRFGTDKEPAEIVGTVEPGSKLMVGRGENSVKNNPLQSLSRKHFEVTLSERGEISVEDVGSMAGIELFGQRLGTDPSENPSILMAKPNTWVPKTETLKDFLIASRVQFVQNSTSNPEEVISLPEVIPPAEVEQRGIIAPEVGDVALGGVEIERIIEPVKKVSSQEPQTTHIELPQAKSAKITEEAAAPRTVAEQPRPAIMEKLKAERMKTLEVETDAEVILSYEAVANVIGNAEGMRKGMAQTPSKEVFADDMVSAFYKRLGWMAEKAGEDANFRDVLIANGALAMGAITDEGVRQRFAGDLASTNILTNGEVEDLLSFAESLQRTRYESRDGYTLSSERVSSFTQKELERVQQTATDRYKMAVAAAQLGLSIFADNEHALIEAGERLKKYARR